MGDIHKIIDELLGDESYASGRRVYPRTVTADDAMAIAEYVHGQVDAGTAAREEAAARDGVTIACGRGCNKCCSELLLVYEPEAMSVARWLSQPENAAVKEAFLAAYPAWREAVGDAPERLTALVKAGDQVKYDAAHVAQTRTGILCAFNGPDGGCMIHPIRPVACRNGHAIDTPDYCRGDHPSGKPAVRLQFKPLDEFLARVRKLERATHNALGKPKWQPQSLVVAVHRLLTKT